LDLRIASVAASGLKSETSSWISSPYLQPVSRPPRNRHLRGKPDDDGAPDPGDIGAVERRRLSE
jgi:hypothetical protein